MEKTIRSELIGSFTYNKEFKAYEHDDGKVNYVLKLENENTNAYELIIRAEKLFCQFDKFEKMAKTQIANKLIEYKNEFWPEFDENDENLNWDDVEDGKYDVSKEEFEGLITLLHIEIRAKNIYCEFNDGDLFGGHRIHADFDNDFNLISADI